MERVVDLDAVLVELLTRGESWRRSGLSAGTWTWRDASAQWPQPIVSDRAVVHDPESLGMTLRFGDDDAAIVLWRGGWADVEASIGGKVLLDAPDFNDVASSVAIVDDLVAALLRGGPKVRTS